jgi:hypothetical protein
MVRVVLREPELKDLQDDFELEKWVMDGDDDRKAAYFAAARHLRETTIQISGGDDPRDSELVDALAYVLMNDPVLRAHVRARRGTSPISRDDWRDILRAAAGTIYECYYADLDDG